MAKEPAPIIRPAGIAEHVAGWSRATLQGIGRLGRRRQHHVNGLDFAVTVEMIGRLAGAVETLARDAAALAPAAEPAAPPPTVSFTSLALYHDLAHALEHALAAAVPEVGEASDSSRMCIPFDLFELLVTIAAKVELADPSARITPADTLHARHIAGKAG